MKQKTQDEVVQRLFNLHAKFIFLPTENTAKLIISILSKTRLDDTQIAKYCAMLEFSHYEIYKPVGFLVKTNQKLTSNHVDILLQSYRHRFDVISMFEYLTPEQIDRCLHDISILVREAAYNHPCCTESQKVWYHLTYG